MYAIVTGAAGFVGSHLSEELVEQGHTVVGVDCFTDYYGVEEKRDNLSALLSHPNFHFVEADLRTADLEWLFSQAPHLHTLDLRDGQRAHGDAADVIFHQAGQPGVRKSWSSGFADYTSHNVLATQRVLEAAKAIGVKRVVYASSSSLYGNAETYPTRETDLPSPYSPYGVTKLAAEHLCNLYASNWGLSTVSLRYFTVYGPRQRPDMAMRRLVDAAVTGETFPLYGTGEQIRDFTYVADIVNANIAAATADVAPGTVVNIAGGSNAVMNDVIDLIGELAGSEIRIDRRGSQAGDVFRTGGATEAASRLLSWGPAYSFRDGLAAQVEWAQQRHEALALGQAS